MRKIDVFICSFAGTLSALVIGWLLLFTIGTHMVRESQKASALKVQQDMARIFGKQFGEEAQKAETARLQGIANMVKEFEEENQ